MTSILREFREEDCEPMASIMCDVWSMASYGADVAMPGSRMYCCQCVLASSFIRVAEVDGRIVGCVGARYGNERIEAPWAKRMLQQERDSVSDSEDGSRMIAEFESYDSIDRDLGIRTGIDTDAELTILILSKHCRGLGLGRMMFDAACDYLRSKGASSMMLYTDTDCNTGFYDALGAERVATSGMMCLGEPLGMFLYRYPLRGFIGIRTELSHRRHALRHRDGTGIWRCTFRSGCSRRHAWTSPCSAPWPSHRSP